MALWPLLRMCACRDTGRNNVQRGAPVEKTPRAELKTQESSQCRGQQAKRRNSFDPSSLLPVLTMMARLALALLALTAVIAGHFGRGFPAPLLDDSEVYGTLRVT
jgi:hypothetical protein